MPQLKSGSDLKYNDVFTITKKNLLPIQKEIDHEIGALALAARNANRSIEIVNVETIQELNGGFARFRIWFLSTPNNP